MSGKLLAAVVACALIAVACDEDKTTVQAELIPGGRGPEADFTINYPYGFPGTVFTLTSRAEPRSGEITEYLWTINGEEHSGKRIEVRLDDPGAFEVVHTVVDNNDRSGSAFGELLVRDHPNAIVRIMSIRFDTDDVGDGRGKDGEVYLLGSAIAQILPGAMSSTPLAFPPGAPTVHWKVQPYDTLHFGGNSGLILYDGVFRDVFGLTFALTEHDSSSGWGFIGDILSKIASLVSGLSAEAGSIIQGAGEVSDLLVEALDDTDDDLVSIHQLAHFPADRYGIGLAHTTYYDGITITYRIDER